MPIKENSKKETPRKEVLSTLELPWNINSAIDKELNTKNGVKNLISVVEEKVKEEEKSRRIPILRKFYEDYHKAVKENESIKPDIDPGYTSELVVKNGGEKSYSKEQGERKRNTMVKINNMVKAYKSWLDTGDWDKFERFCKTIK